MVCPKLNSLSKLKATFEVTRFGMNSQSANTDKFTVEGREFEFRSTQIKLGNNSQL